MNKPRIAVLFDAENTACSTVEQVLRQLRQIGTVQSACAVGDFSNLAGWVDCAREHGIDLVLQPSLGKGKNSADIRLAIEAMDLIHRSRLDTVALVTRDRDFAPLAFRLRESGIVVLGFSPDEPSIAFRAACSEFNVLTAPTLPANEHPSRDGRLLTTQEQQKLKNIVSDACRVGTIDHVSLYKVIKDGAPELATRLQGKFLKHLLAYSILVRVGSGAAQRFTVPALAARAKVQLRLTA